MRLSKSGGTPATLVNWPSSATGPFISNLKLSNNYLYWQEGETVQKLAANASALPNINMRIFAPSGIGTGIEVTQGLQSLNNTVTLVQNRRTIVRVYTRSDGAPISGVAAQLVGSVVGSNAYLGTLQPVNPAGTKLTVRSSPVRTDLDQSFLFELPWNWTTKGPIQLIATINPYRSQLEPNYTDNTASTGTLTFRASPTLSAEFFRLNYQVGSTTYAPRITKDVLQTYSWIMRVYPIGGAVGTNFRPRLWDVAGGTQLGNWVTQTSKDCDKVAKDQGDRALCASYYTNGWLKYYRDHGWVTNTKDFYYGMIADGGGFPRGQAMYSQTSVGPSGSGTFGWDTDGSYADWYAGHEIGHSLGRNHPNAGSDDPATLKDSAGNPIIENCGHSRSDPSFPYGNTSSSAAPIGPSSGSIEGFDIGDPAFGIPMQVLPSSTWNDMMSYCNNQWISDYTYNAIFNYMTAHPSAVLAAAQPAVGEYLSVSGSISAADDTGSFSFVRRLSQATEIPALVDGGYVLRLVDAGGNELASHGFTPIIEPESGNKNFSQIIDFVAGTRGVQLLKGDGTLLASMAVSANPPSISDVALVNAPDPVSGVVTLGWNASDPDGDALSFDVFYSRDGGTTFQPVAMNLSGSSTSIDTASLGGSGTALLRVVATDGVHTAEASSATFTMAAKPPQPYILTPGDNTHISYGQLLNFSGMAFDAQDNLVAAGGLVWTNAQGTVLGNGPLMSVDSLPVGVNEITLTATNSAGVAASTTITIVVDDDLTLPGATLSVGPGQVGWQVAPGAAAQTAQVTIGNSGSGDLNWTASSDQPWLTLSAASGTVSSTGEPTTLTLTADPTGLAANQPYSANVTITGGGQTKTVQVSLSIGDVWNNYTPAPLQPEVERVFLPLLGQ